MLKYVMFGLDGPSLLSYKLTDEDLDESSDEAVTQKINDMMEMATLKIAQINKKDD